jgi:hypothetical protein
MLSEEQLLARILDEATTPAEREIAIRALKRLTGTDRSDLADEDARKAARAQTEPLRQPESQPVRQPAPPSPGKAVAVGVLALFGLSVIGILAVTVGPAGIAVIVVAVVALLLLAMSRAEGAAHEGTHCGRVGHHPCDLAGRRRRCTRCSPARSAPSSTSMVTAGLRRREAVRRRGEF